MKTLVIGDAHADPRHNNKRFDALGNFVAVNQPENIVQIGDWGSYDSVSFHERGNARLSEGKRLVDDFAASRDAYNRLMKPIDELNKGRARNHKSQYKFNGIWFESNHEYRIKRYVDENPVLEGFIPEKDLVGATNDGWNLIDWKYTASINGVTFTHIPINDGNGQPISGKYVARRAAEMYQSTVVFGHTHRFLVESLSRVSSDAISFVEGINVGWFGDYTPDYITGHPGIGNWWSGLVVLHHTARGQVDIERISMDRLKKEYA